MNRFLLIAIVLGTFAASSGCVYRLNIAQGNLIEQKDLDQVELGMTARTADTVQAFRAADAGLRAALASGAWDPAVEWHNPATLPGGARWPAAMRLAAVGVPPPPAPTEWHFEIESTGELDGATASLVQGFVVRGALPGTAEPSWWRQEDPEP
jgi:hypothetical protein